MNTDYTDPSTINVDTVIGNINHAHRMRGHTWTDERSWPNVTVKALADEIDRLRALVGGRSAVPTREQDDPAWALDAAGNPTCDGVTIVPSRQRGAAVRCTSDAATDVVVLHADAHASLVALLSRSAAEPPEVTHACPPGDAAVTPCCGRTPFELPFTDRMTLDADLVTCGVAAEPSEEHDDD